MPWLKIVPIPHSCYLPYSEIKEVDVGSIWRCPEEECGEYFKLVSGEDGNYFSSISRRRALRILAKSSPSQLVVS